MGLFSLLRKNKQENSTSGDSGFRSRSEEESKAVRGRGKRKQRDQAAEPVDPVLPQKKRARRRLVGALALVLAVVIGLPMVLDSEPKPLANDIAIQIPSKDKAAVPGNSPQTGNQQPAAGISAKVAASASLEQKEEVVEMSGAAGTAAKEPGTAPEALPSSVSEQALLSAQPAGRNEAKPAEAAAGKTEAKVADEAADKVNEAARAKAILEGKPDGKVNTAQGATDQKSGKFVVQVAALASREKINELQTKLNDAGIRSYTQKVATESGDRTRIRVGPFTNKEEAEKMRAKLNKLGLNGTVVPPGQ